MSKVKTPPLLLRKCIFTTYQQAHELEQEQAHEREQERAHEEQEQAHELKQGRAHEERAIEKVNL